MGIINTMDDAKEEYPNSLGLNNELKNAKVQRITDTQYLKMK